MQDQYLSWQQGRLWNMAKGRPGGTSALIFNQMQALKSPFQVTEYAGKVDKAIMSRKFRLKLIKWYTLMMRQIFESIMKVVRQPMYLFDVAIALYSLPRVEAILKAIIRLLKRLARIIKP